MIPGTNTGAVSASAGAYQVYAGVAAEDCAKAIELWRDCGFGSSSAERDVARYRWFYQVNPQGEGQINFMRQDASGPPLGFLGVGCRRWLLRGESVFAGVLVDFVVHPQHRSASPALQLQRQGRERATATMTFLYGLPHTKAIPIFKRLGAQYELALVRYARVLRAAVYLRRLMPQWLARPLAAASDVLDVASMKLRLVFSRNRGAWHDGFDARFDELWQQVDKSSRSIGVRSREFLQWRFGAQPGHQYRTFVIRHRDRDALHTYFVCELIGDQLIVKDFLSIGTRADVRDGLLLLCLQSIKLGAAIVSIQACGDAVLAAALRSVQFIERDRRWLYASVPEAARGSFEGLAWYLTQADEDI
ncbi:MAG TPA: hypothetical protein PKE27_00295 [Povalibacter sp.]|uniref:hypothetical protein n=1 Tax=Povalibacter sp. TaxID=1962978 RepID=UPI002BF10F3B|nr:hypothetical protein [Povalibacter sp.]HMN42986.1 hypothetical protein [Povalibacter sp.]